MSPQSTFGNNFKIEIRDRNRYISSSRVAYISKAGATPVIIEMKTDNQDIFDPLRFISHKLSLIAISTQDWETIIENFQDNRYQIVTDQTDNEIRTYLTNDEITIPFKYYPFEMNFEGFEGFHILKTYPISDVNGNAFTGYVTLMQVLAGALYKLPSNDYSIYVSATLIESNMNANTSSFLSQTYIEADSLYEDNEPIDCVEAIRRILGPFGMVIFIKDKNWHIVHVSEINVTDLKTYQYNALGAIVATNGTLNTIITLTDNTEARQTRKNWLNNNCTVIKKPGYNTINITTNRAIKPTIYKYSYFKDFITKTISASQYHELPEEWTNEGYWEGTSGVRKLRAGKYTYNGQDYYPALLPIIQNYLLPITSLNLYYVGKMTSRHFYLKVLAGTNPNIRLVVKIRYRLYNAGVQNEGVKASFFYSLQHIRLNSGVSTTVYHNDDPVQWTGGSVVNNVVKTNLSTEYQELTIETANLGQSIDETGYINITISRPFALELPSPLTNLTGVGLLIKNIDIKLQYDNSDEGLDYIDIPETQEYKEISAGKFTKGEYKKELYYNDIGRSEEDTNENYADVDTIKKMSYNNNFYYYDGSNYQLTSEWIYGTSQLTSASYLYKVLMNDLYQQYGTQYKIVNGDLQIYNANLLSIFHDTVMGLLLQPLNAWYDLKKDTLSGEFMQNKLSVPAGISETKYIVDENGDAIIDENSDEILYE